MTAPKPESGTIVSIIDLWEERQQLWQKYMKINDEQVAAEDASGTNGLTPAIRAIEERSARACRAVYAVDGQIRKHEPQSLSEAAILLRVLAYDCDIEHGADGAKELKVIIAFLEKGGDVS